MVEWEREKCPLPLPPVAGGRADPELMKWEKLALYPTIRRADPALHPGSEIERTLLAGAQVNCPRGHGAGGLTLPPPLSCGGIGEGEKKPSLLWSLTTLAGSRGALPLTSCSTRESGPWAPDLGGTLELTQWAGSQ